MTSSEAMVADSTKTNEVETSKIEDVGSNGDKQGSQDKFPLGSSNSDSVNNTVDKVENDNRTSNELNPHVDNNILTAENIGGSDNIEALDNSNPVESKISFDTEFIKIRELSKEDIIALPPDDLWHKWQCLVNTVDRIKNKSNDTKLDASEEDGELSDSMERLKGQLAECQRKEAYLIMRLTTKEHELQEIAASLAASKCFTVGRTSLLDPSVNLTMERLKKDLETARSKMEEAQNELAAWKFTPDSNTGKQLMAKCRLLIKENEELGRVISSGKLAKLEGDIALQRNFTEELKKSQSELDEFLLEMDEDTEGMQGTIVFLQSELRAAKLQLQSSAAPAEEESREESNEELIAAVEEQIIPHNQLEEPPLTNGKKRGVEEEKEEERVGEEEVLEPPCKRAKASLCGEGDSLENGED